MSSDIQAMELPAFELDCRDWLVATPEDGCVADEIGGAPVVAMLSTVVIGPDDLTPGSVVLSVGLMDESPADATGSSPELLELDPTEGTARYVVPAPGRGLALLAEFSCDRADAELMARFDRLMSSFKWAS